MQNHISYLFVDGHKKLFALILHLKDPLLDLILRVNKSSRVRSGSPLIELEEHEFVHLLLVGRIVLRPKEHILVVGLQQGLTHYSSIYIVQFLLQTLLWLGLDHSIGSESGTSAVKELDQDTVVRYECHL